VLLASLHLCTLTESQPVQNKCLPKFATKTLVLVLPLAEEKREKKETRNAFGGH
jgi:hypothetical protein